MKRMLPLAFAALLLGGPSGRAEDFLGQLDLVRQLYEEGDIAGAMVELDFARQALQEKLGERFAATFPEPPEGWEAQPAQVQPGGMPGGGMMVSRTYVNTGGPGRIEAQIIANSPMIQAFAAMLTNPAMMTAEPGSKRVRIGRSNAVLTWDGEARSGEMRLMVGQAMISLEGQALESSDPLVELMKKFDLKTLKELTAG